MSRWLIAVVTLIYLVVAVDQWRKGAAGPALMFSGYALANVGVVHGGVSFAAAKYICRFRQLAAIKKLTLPFNIGDLTCTTETAVRQRTATRS